MRLITTALAELDAMTDPLRYGLLPDIRDRRIESASFIDAVIVAERMADALERSVYLREIGNGAWRVRVAPFPYYSSSEIEIKPEHHLRVAPRNVNRRKRHRRYSGASAQKHVAAALRAAPGDPWAGVDYSR